MSTKGRITRRTALAATAMTVFATPAFASLVIQSYMSADITVADNCLVTKAGEDVTSYSVVDGPFVNMVTGDATPTRVTLEEDKITVAGMHGDRVIYNDVARIQNTCAVALDVTLSMDGSQGSGWTDRYAEVYLSSTALALDSVAPLGYPTDATGNWTANPIAVDSTGSAVAATSTTVTLPAGQELRVAALIEAGTDAANLTNTSTMSWEVTAFNSNGR